MKASTPVQSQRVFLLFFAVFAGLAFARCFTNLPWCDEGWFFDTVYNLLTKGHTGTTVMVAKGFPWEGIERYQFWQPPLFWIIDAAWMKVFGLSLVAYRSLSVVAGLVLLYCWYTMLRWFRAPRAVQLLAMAILATDYAVVKAGSDGRMDMLAAAFGIAGVTVYVRWRESHFDRAVLLGQALICCGGLTHPMGGLPYLAMFFWFFITGRDWRRVRPVHLLAAMPYLIGAAGWGIYILQDPVTFRKIFFGSNVKGRMDGIFNPLMAVRNEVVARYLEPFGLRSSFWVVKSKLLVPAVYLASMIAVWATPSLRREAFLRPFLAMWSIAALSLIFLDAQRNGTYMIHVFPLYGILLASLCWWLWNRAGGPIPRVAVAAAVTGFVVFQAAGSLYLIATNPFRRQYLPVVEYVKKIARPSDRVVGSGELGFGLGFENVYDDKALGYYVNAKPDVIVLSPRYQAWFASESKDEPEVYRFVMNRMAEYRPVFRTQAFEVYVPLGRVVLANERTGGELRSPL